MSHASSTGQPEGVEAAVRVELDESASVSVSLVATAIALAREIDMPGNSATSKSMCAKALNETLDRIRQLAPADEESDDLDELTVRRKLRIAGSPGT